MFDLIGREQPQHLGKASLDGIRILEDGQGYHAALPDIQVNLQARPMESHVEEAVLL
jgi:hypothetical protein